KAADETASATPKKVLMRMARFPMALLPSYRFFFGSLTSDLKVASRRRTANTSYPCRRRASELLEVWLDDRALSIPADGVPDGPARLFMRPQDVAVVDESAGAIAGVVTATHRNGGLRRCDISIGDGHTRNLHSVSACESPYVAVRRAWRTSRCAR